MDETLAIGDVALVALPSSQPRGREQEGQRPAIVVGIPQGRVRFPMLLIAPLTSQEGEWVQNNRVLYPTLEAGAGGLTRRSVVLLDQIRAIDARRLVAYLGSLTPAEHGVIAPGLKQIFGF